MKTLLIIDGHALAYREYFALERTAMSTTDKQPTWAVYGFFKKIFDILKHKTYKIDAVVVTFDVSRKSFRTEQYSEYKAQRESMPDNMRSQIRFIQEGLKAFDIPIYLKAGYEADDVIGSISKKASELGHKTYILTGDKDCFQLIDKQGTVKVLLPSGGSLLTFDWDKVYENLGVYPNQIIDYKALKGDKSDNIPGVKGIGDKKTQDLLKKFGNVENIYSNLDSIENAKLKSLLTEGREYCFLSKNLATIVRDLDVNFDFENACLNLPDLMTVTKFFQKMQFLSYIKDIDKIMSYFNVSCNSSSDKPVQPKGESQLSLFSEVLEENLQKETEPYEIFNISSAEAIEKLSGQDNISISIGVEDNSISDIAFGLKKDDKILIYAIENAADLKKVSEDLKPIFENDKIKKSTQNSKQMYLLFKKAGIELSGISFDTMLASYVKDPARKHDLENQAMEHLNFIIPEKTDVRKETYAIIKLTEFWQNNLDEKELKLLNDIELPLSKILAYMEYTGVSIDEEYLNELTAEYMGILKEVEKTVFRQANTVFNINSPKQVAQVLYENCGIKEVKKGNKFSTSAEILDDLAHSYDICKDILEYRKYSKLISTYTTALPKLVSKETGKIHTNFNQTITTTGRLSSSNPNLQNIPAREEDSQKIRKAFIPENRETQVLLSADYSQIELRLLAHCSGDERLTKAFISGEDIHTQTASEIFNVSLDEVTKEMRRKAKAVNFGIVYGQSKYGLSKTLGIDTKTAGSFIEKYFETYPKVQEYIDKTMEFVNKNGYVETIYGRKRYLGTNLNSTNRYIKEAALRAAINQPLQGSAADLIKMAMITLFRRLTELEMQSKIILQVHDELIIQTQISELDNVKTIVKDSMELNQPLNVPLVVDIVYGKNWVEI